MCSAYFYLRAWIHGAKFVLRELLLRIIYVFLNKKFSRNNFCLLLYNYSFIDNINSKHDPETTAPSWI